MNPGTRPRRGLAAALVASIVAGAAVVAVVAAPEQADASGLETFASCTELEAWGEDAQAASFGGVAEELAADGMAAAPTTTAAATTSGAASAETADDGLDRSGAASGSGADEGATNVIVDGVDELDIVERLDDRRALAVANATLALVDLDAGEVLARTTVPWSAQVSYDPEARVAWVAGFAEDGSGVVVSRVSVGDASLDGAGTWTTPGQLAAARRVGGVLHVVASDGFVGVDGPALPFGGGALPCDEVLHPEGTSDPTATLLVSLPVEGDLTPTHTAEVVGSGQLVHVTLDAAYLATPRWDGEAPTTGIHRFDLDDLTHTGSGSVEGTMLNEFSLSEHDGHLRVATTVGSPVGRPIAIDGGPAVDVVGPDVAVDPDTPVGSDGSVGVGSSGAADPSSGAAGAEEPAAVPQAEGPETTVAPTTVPPGTEPPTTEPPTTEPTVPSTTTTMPPPTTEPSVPTTLPEPSTTIVPVPEPTVPPVEGEALNQVVVLDTEGDLDVVGTTARFGHPGETIHGVRFDGSVGYAVTFLQTDPFYVLDLADPAAPTVVGEVELPGFSAYLHPVGAGHVVGFGPGDDGRATAKLFDVSDPAAPEVVDAVVLGDESAVVWDHHAFTSLGERRFAVPATSWSTLTVACGAPVPEPMPVPEEGSDPGAGIAPGMPAPCSGVRTEAVELEVDGDQLVEVARVGTTLAEPGSRLLPVDDGWAIVAGSTIAVLDGAGQTRSTISLG